MPVPLAGVQESLSYFVDMYASLAEWRAVVERLTGFGGTYARGKTGKTAD